VADPIKDLTAEHQRSLRELLRVAGEHSDRLEAREKEQRKAKMDTLADMTRRQWGTLKASIFTVKEMLGDYVTPKE